MYVRMGNTVATKTIELKSPFYGLWWQATAAKDTTGRQSSMETLCATYAEDPGRGLGR